MSKHKKHHNQSHQNRRDQFAHPPARRARVSPTAIVFAMAALFAGILGYLIVRGGGVRGEPVTEIAAAGADVSLPAGQFDDGQARFYRYTTTGGREVRFFVMKSSDGVVRAAFDACDVCYRERRGYRQQGDVMVCNNCGQKFACDKIGEGKGGCNPHPLAHKEEAGFMVIRKADIVAGKDYFARKRS